MLDRLNKSRKKACALSLLLTIVVVILTALLIYLVRKSFIFAFFGIIVLIAGLYLLSNFIVIPKYNKIKASIISMSIKDELNNVECQYIKPFTHDLSVFFNINNMSYTNPISFDYNNYKFLVEDFIIKEKIKGQKKEQITFQGKFIKVNIKNLFNKDTVAIPNFCHESKEFENKFSTHFKNATLKSNTTFKGKYLSNNDDKNDLIKIASIFERINNFHLLIYKGDVLTIMLKEKCEKFEFNLQNEITLEILEKAKISFKGLNDVLIKIKEINNG